MVLEPFGGGGGLTVMFRAYYGGANRNTQKCVSQLHSDTLSRHNQAVDKWTNTDPSEVAVTANVVGGKYKCHHRHKIVEFCGQTFSKEHLRGYLGSCTVVDACTPST